MHPCSRGPRIQEISYSTRVRVCGVSQHTSGAEGRGCEKQGGNSKRKLMQQMAALTAFKK